MVGLEEVYESAEKILLNGPDPVVRLRILRDVLQKPGDSQEVIEARRNVNHSRWVRVLTEEQWEDGSWGAVRTLVFIARAACRIPRLESLGCRHDAMVMGSAQS